MAKKPPNPNQGGLLTGEMDYRSFYQPDPMHLPRVDWRPPKAHELPSWTNAKRVAIDVECKDPQLKQLGPGVRRPWDSRVVGIGFAIEDGPSHYLSISHEGGDNCDFNVWEYVADQLRNFNGVIVGNGLGYDGDWIEQGVQNYHSSILNKRWMDVQIADPLINELHRNYNLDALCERHGLPGKDETVLREAAAIYRCDPKKDLWRMPGRYAAQYCIVDCLRPLQVLRRQEAIIEREKLQQIWALEQKVTPICVKMRRRGVRIDVNHLEAIERMTYIKEQEALDEVRRLTGIRVNVGDSMKTAVLAPAFRAAGYVIPKTEVTISAKTGKKGGGNDSIDKDFLKKAGKLGAAVSAARGWARLRTTNVAEVKEALIGDRVHVTFNQLRADDDDGDGQGVRYGRFSSTDFNVQAQPGRDDEIGPLWRACYIADEGSMGWGCSDWSQQEPRIGVHYAEIIEKQTNGRECRGAHEFAEEYRRNPALDIHQKLTDIANDPVNLPRKIIKNFVNGRLYGMGDTKLCWSCGWSTEWKVVYGKDKEVPTAESRAKIEMFNDFAPWITGLTRAAAKAAEKNGCVWTYLRRRCNFEKGPDGKIWKVHKAFNRIGQGSAADQMKATLVAAEEAGIPVQMAVHDEFDFSFESIKQAKQLKELQMSVVQFNVPMKVDLEVGKNWGHMVKVEALESVSKMFYYKAAA